MIAEPGVGSGWLGVTAECKVPAAAVDVPTEGGCGVSGPFDYEYANAACHESKARERTEREKERKEGDGLKDRQRGCGEEGGETLSYFFWMCTVYFIGLFSGTGVNAQFVCLAQRGPITLGNIRDESCWQRWARPIRHFLKLKAFWNCSISAPSTGGVWSPPPPPPHVLHSIKSLISHLWPTFTSVL